MTEDESWGEYEDEINEFIHYLEKTWIGRILGRSNARQSPMFKYEMWSIHVDILDGSKYTSNSVEAWNNAWNSSLEKNASVWKVVQGFRREDGIVKGKLRDIMFGNLPSEDARSRAEQSLYFPEFVFQEFVIPEFVIQEFVTAPKSGILGKVLL